MNNTVNQSFNVDDIRRLRDEFDKTRGDMSAAELTLSISEGAKEGLRILGQPFSADAISSYHGILSTL